MRNHTNTHITNCPSQVQVNDSTEEKKSLYAKLYKEKKKTRFECIQVVVVNVGGMKIDGRKMYYVYE